MLQPSVISDDYASAEMHPLREIHDERQMPIVRRQDFQPGAAKILAKRQIRERKKRDAL
jgi:hypothetical protein